MALKSKQVSTKDKQFLLFINPKDMDYKFFCSIFEKTLKRDENGKMKVMPARMQAFDTLSLSPSEYKYINNAVETTVGSLLVNRFITEYLDAYDILGFENRTITEEVLKDIDAKMTDAVSNKRLGVEEYIIYKERTEWLGMRLHSLLSGSFTMKTIIPLPAVVKEREKLIKENKESLEKGDAIVYAKIEKQLLDLAHNELKGDPGLQLYDSGARGSFDNNYKNICVTRGTIFNPTTGKNDIVPNGFMEGLDKSEIPAMANTVTLGAYPKAIGTGVSGHLTKMLLAGMQAVTVDPNLIDCNSKSTIPVKITKSNKKEYLTRYIIDNGKLIHLNDKNIDQYINKTVNVRSIMTCCSKRLCVTCAGTRYNDLNIENIGVTSAKLSGTMLNLSMKAFHNSTTELYEIDINNLSL